MKNLLPLCNRTFKSYCLRLIFCSKNLGHGCFQHHGHAVLVVGRSLLPAAHLGHGAQLAGRHCPSSRPARPTPAYPHRSSCRQWPWSLCGPRPGARPAAASAHPFETPGGSRSRIDRSRAGYSVRTHSQLAAPLAGLERFLGLAHLRQAARYHALNGVFAVRKGELQRLDHLNGVAVGLDP